MNQDSLNVFKALSDQTRIKIVKKLIDNKETACQDLMKYFSLSQPTLSHHFNKLLQSKILRMRKDGTSHYYSVNKKYLVNLGIDIDKAIKS